MQNLMSHPSRKLSGANDCLIDWFRPAEADGPLLGAVLSTYGLALDQPDFFGQDFLPTLLGLGGIRDRGYSSPLALDRSLAATDVVLLCDPHALADGIRPTLRVDLLPIGSRNAVGGSERRIHHSKIQLVHRQNLIRLVVASANLTHEGYRKQREAAVILDFHDHSALSSSILVTALERWTAALGEFANDRVQRIFKAASEQAVRWSNGSLGQKGVHIEVLFGGGQVPLWHQLIDAWPTGESILDWSICSPFWSLYTPGRTRNPFEEIAAGLTSKGCDMSGCELEIVTRADSPNENALPRFPFELLRHLRASKSFPVRKGRILPAQLPSSEDEIPDGMAAENRDLHAKWIAIAGPKTAMAIIGSANFTSRGMGVLRDSTDANLEACVLLRWARGKWNPKSWRPPILGRIIDWDECKDTDLKNPAKDDEPLTDWPFFIKEIELGINWERLPEPDGILSVHLLCSEEPRKFTVSTPDTASGKQIGAHDAQKQNNTVDIVKILVDPDCVRALLARRVVRVSWGHGRSALFPINISQESRIGMPSILGAKPSEEQLLAYFHGRISEDDLLARLTEQAENNTEQRPVLAEDSERRKKMQSYIVRDFVESLFGLVITIKESARSPRAAEQAMMGDFSPVSLSEQVIQAFMAGRRSPAATAFQMVELITAVASIKWPDDKFKTASDRTAYEQIRERTLNRLYERLSQAALRSEIKSVLQDPDFQKYAASTLPSSVSSRWESFLETIEKQGQSR
jgi:hypothetical protein